ncbi:hypothetical protein [Nonomuraea fuscirosea]|uniref:hypothetical protein n=1 Tax=Nonomuraea fuscirosea TaxID=1291556 RepID=UPI0034274FF7
MAKSDAAGWGVVAGVALGIFAVRFMGSRGGCGRQHEMSLPVMRKSHGFKAWKLGPKRSLRKFIGATWKVWIYVALFSVVGVCVFLGYATYGVEFSSNLLGEGAGIFVSVVIGFALVDRLIEVESRRKWRRVKEFTKRTIESRLQEIHFILETHLHLVVQGERTWSASTLAEDFRNYAAHIRENAEALANPHSEQQVIIDESRQDLADTDDVWSASTTYEEDGTPITYVGSQRAANALRDLWDEEGSSTRLYGPIMEHVQHLQEQLLPRIIEFDYEPKLIEALISLEQAQAFWKSTLQVRDDWGLPEEYAWRTMAGVLQECAVLAEEIDASLGHPWQ